MSGTLRSFNKTAQSFFGRARKTSAGQKSCTGLTLWRGGFTGENIQKTTKLGLNNRRVGCYNSCKRKASELVDPCVPALADRAKRLPGKIPHGDKELPLWLIPLPASASPAALVLTPARSARSAWPTRLLWTLPLASIAAPARVSAPPARSRLSNRFDKTRRGVKGCFCLSCRVSFCACAALPEYYTDLTCS